MKKEKSFFLDVLSTVTKYFLIFICLLMVYLLCSGIRVIKNGDVAVVLRFGKVVGNNYEQQVKKSGLLLAFPNFIDEVIVIPANNVMVQNVDTHYTSAGGFTGIDGGYLLTGDQNVAVVSASVKYIVSHPVNYATHVKDISGIINATVSTGMLNKSSEMKVDDLLTSKKDEFANDVKNFAMEKINKLAIGIEITSLELTQVSMANEVKYIFDEVNGATVKAETIIEEANTEAQRIAQEAKKKYDNIVSRATEAVENLKGQSKTELAEFWGYIAEYENAKDLVEKKVYAEKVVEALNKIKEIRVVEGDGYIIIK